MKSRSKTQISSDYEGKKVFGCEVCGKIFTNETRLAEHIGGVHEGKRPFKCEICHYKSSQKAQIKSHIALQSISKASFERTHFNSP